MVTVVQTRIGATHVRFDVVDAAADHLLVDALEKRARVSPAAILRINPYPAIRAHQSQQVVPAKPLPTFKITL